MGDTTLPHNTIASAADMQQRLSEQLADQSRELVWLKDTLDRTALVSITDANGVILHANPQFCAVSQYSVEELMGQTHKIVNSDHHTPEFWRNMWQTIQSGQIWRGDIKNRAKDGSEYWVRSVINPVFDEAGHIIKYVSIRQDITKKKRIEQELQQTKDAMERANQAKSVFLANMSHEIRTPLNGMMGMIELLLGTALSAEQIDYAQTAYRSAEALMTILNDILDFSKIEAGHLQLEILPFDLRQMIFDVVDLFRGRITHEHLAFLIDIDPQIPTRIMVDGGRMRQILTNLVGNAAKFTEKGHILVGLRIVEQAETGKSVLQMYVQDTGIGIPLEKQSTLFRPFTQADVSTSRKYGGTGLGLAIARQLVKLMQGEIHLESRLGEGTTFTVQIPYQPVVQDAAQNTDVRAPIHTDVLRHKRVLLVDPQAARAHLVMEHMQKWGVRVLHIPDVSPAAYLSMLQESTQAQEKIDAVIWDSTAIDPKQMHHWTPEIRGSVPWILLWERTRQSGYTLDQIRDWGFIGHIRKPASIESLIQVLTDVWTEVRKEVRTEVPQRVPQNVPQSIPHSVPHILLVEDNPVNQKLACVMLRKIPAHVTVANNGKEALDLLEIHTQTHPIDVILMDCQMPDMDGFEATKIIRNREAQATTGYTQRKTIVAMTANAMSGDREECLAAGMDDYLAKPMQSASLRAMIEKWYVPKKNG